MRTVASAIVVAFVALSSAVVLAFSVTISTTVQLLNSFALEGTQTPVLNVTSDQAISQEAIDYGGPFGVTSPVTVVEYPAQFRPFSVGGWTGETWNQSVATGVQNLQAATAGQSAPVIFGYSQGAIVASEYKKDWNQQNAGLAPGSPTPTFVLLGNGDRPNGGVLARFSGLYVPILDLTATSATPTTTAGAKPGQITTTDIAGQYDPIADFPTNPLNVLADVNAGMGLLYVHLNYANINPQNAVLQDQYGDTAYYLIPTYPLPLLMPLESVPVIGPVAADMRDPVLRVLVEAGYDRNISPGQPTTANFLYFPNPVSLGSDLLLAVPTGLDNGSQDLGMGRPLGTAKPQIGPGTTGQGAYGIGGPPVTMDPTTTSATQNAASTQQQTPDSQTNTADTNGTQSPPLAQQPSVSDAQQQAVHKLFSIDNTPWLPTTGTTSGSSTPSATQPSQPTLNNPIGAGSNNVANSISSAVSGLSKLAGSALSGK